MMRSVLSTLIISALLASCGIIDMRKEEGNGNIRSENRSQKNFRGVESYGSFDVYVTTANSYSVKVEADENLLQYIKTSVEDGFLKISTASGVSIDPSDAMNVYVSAPVFNKLSTSGSGNVITQNQIVSDDQLEVSISGSGDIKADIKSASVSSDISGSGDITISGETKSFKINIEGDGDVKAENLQTAEAKINIAGSGNALVNAAKKLEVHIAGSGDVKYLGHPDISQSVAGSGSIQKAD